MTMKVTKRDGVTMNMKFDKVTSRISKLTSGLSSAVSADKVAQKVFSSMYDGIRTKEVDDLSAEIAVGMITEDPDYEILATRIVASNLQKTCPKFFSNAMELLKDHGVLSDYVWSIVIQNEEYLNQMIFPERDSDFGFFGIKTLEKGYLQQIDGYIVETPQYMFLRVALGIHGTDLKRVKTTYDLMSRGYFTHATPTLFNAGTPRPQMSSCFLVAMKDDSIDGIYDTIKECAQISKWAGGIGLHLHNVRANNSKIKGTNGISDGIIPMLRVFNSTARYVNQAGKRKGSIAVYLEPWHADIMEFLELRLNQGDEEARARDLFTALWIPDLFMKRVQEGGDWSLFSPDEAPGLPDCYGDEFEQLYQKYESDGKARVTMPASKIWMAILKSQTETGTPYMLYKDAFNKKSNQKNLGVMKSSNLCTEIGLVSNKDETAVCNLASLALPKFIVDGRFNYTMLHDVVRTVTRNIDRVIEGNYYPVETARRSNMRHRPIGLGVQGLADVFILMGLPFDHPEARKINKNIFETIYHAGLTESCLLAIENGPYETFKGSPMSEGLFQFDLWDGETEHSGLWNWDNLRAIVKANGIRNSLLVAPMPTASTSQILGNNECIEPYTTNIYLRRTLAGEFVVVNKHLVKTLKELGLWSKEMKNLMIAAGGSIQNIKEIPDDVKAIFRTVWEISQKSLIDMAADRGRYIDQSQSLNLFIESPTVPKMSSMHMYAWKSGLKTGMYYLRTKAKSKAIQFTLEPCTTCSA